MSKILIIEGDVAHVALNQACNQLGTPGTDSFLREA